MKRAYKVEVTISPPTNPAAYCVLARRIMEIIKEDDLIVYVNGKEILKVRR